MVVLFIRRVGETRGGAIERVNSTSLLPGPGKNLRPMSTKKALYTKGHFLLPSCPEGGGKVAENSCLDQAIWVIKII
jgi:hypothetical protein